MIMIKSEKKTVTIRELTDWRHSSTPPVKIRLFEIFGSEYNEILNVYYELIIIKRNLINTYEYICKSIQVFVSEKLQVYSKWN